MSLLRACVSEFLFKQCEDLWTGTVAALKTVFNDTDNTYLFQAS